MGAFQRPVRSHTFPQTHPYVYRPSLKWGGLIHRWTIRVRILCWKGLQPPIPTAQASVFLLRDCVLPGSCIPQPLTRRRGRCNSASWCFAWWYHRFHWNLGLTALQPVLAAGHVWWSKLVHFMVPLKRKRQEEVSSPSILQVHAPSDITSSHEASLLRVSSPPNNIS